MRNIGEIVLIYYQDQPSVYARIEAIETDIKKGWYHITLLLLTIPVQSVTWILRDSYIDGSPFTMGGRSIRLEEVKTASINRENTAGNNPDKKKVPSKPGKVIPLKQPPGKGKS